MASQAQSQSSTGTNELGALVAEHGYRGSRQQITWAVLGFVFCGFAALAAVGFIMASPDDRSVILWAVLLPAALAALLLSLAFLRNPTVRVFNDGLAIINGTRIDVCRWDEVESFRQALTVNQATLGGIPIVKGPTLHQYFLKRRDGKEFKFEENYRKVAELGEAIRRATVPVMLASANKRLAKGEAVDFGGIRVDRTGIKQEPYQPATWEQIRERQFLIAEGEFMICKEYKQVFLGVNMEGTVVFGPVANIPNFTVLLALIDQHVPLPPNLHMAFLDGLVDAPR